VESASRVAIKGFAVIGAISTAIWAIALVTSKPHHSIWEFLSAGLACFLAAALLEVWTLSRKLDKVNKLDEFLTVMTDVSQEGRDLLSRDTSQEAHDKWLDAGVAKIAPHNPHYAHLLAQPLESRDLSSARGLIGMRLKVLEGLIRDQSNKQH
jgi:hypothetical protein